MSTKVVTTFLTAKRRVLAWMLAAILSLSVASDLRGQERDANALVARQCWQYRSADVDSWPVANDGANVYIAERGGRISAISADDGKRIWSTEIGGEVRSNLVLAGHSLHVVTGTSKGPLEMRSLSIVSGIATGSVPVSGSGSVSLKVSGERIVVIASNGSISAVDSAGAAVLWSGKLDGLPEVAAVHGDGVAVGISNGEIAFINALTGAVTQKLKTKFRPTELLISDKSLLVGDERGNLTRYEEPKFRSMWTFKSGGKISGVYPIDDLSLLVTSFDNFVYKVEMSTGHVVWKIREASRVMDTVLISPNVAAVSPFGEPITALVDLDRGKQIGQLALPETSRLVQPTIYVRNAFVTFTSEGLISSGIGRCGMNEKAEANTSAFK